MAHKRKRKPLTTDFDSVFMLKLVLYLILGLQWVWLTDASGQVKLMLPVGLALGILFAQHEHFRIDRRIEYTALFIAAFMSFLLNLGIYITI